MRKAREPNDKLEVHYIEVVNYYALCELNDDGDKAEIQAD